MATILVAIPSENDYVWKLSSEKIPHMTILYLDEDSVNSNFAQVSGFIEHAADTMLIRFGLDVDRRDELGEDKADVIFFNKNHRWSGFKDVCAFRDMLLKEDNVKTANDKAEQFDEWIPHLTMGYPTSPAKKDERDYPGISHVSFDRLAIWTDKYDGPELLLKEQNMADDIAYAAMGEEAIQHHGILGMRWGVRKDSNGRSKGTPSAEADSAKAVKKKAKKQGLSSLSNSEIEALNRRTQLESQYKKDNPSLVAQGADIALDLLDIYANQPVIPKKKAA